MVVDPIKHLGELAKHEAICRRLKEIGNKNAANNLQNVHTPFPLVRDMLAKLDESSKLNGTILTFNLEFIEVMLYDYKVDPTKITYYTDCLAKSEFIKRTLRYNGVSTVVAPFHKLNINMKFDVIVGNPPYQTSPVNTKTQPLWYKFVDKAFDLVKEDGYVCMVHPSGWRDISGKFEKTKNLMNSKQVEYLEIHDIKDGQKTFGVTTRYDWYVIKNTDNDQEETTVKFQDGSEGMLNLNEFGFIPNGNLEELRKIIAKSGEERVNLLYDSTAYHTQKDYMSNVKHGAYQHPCVANVDTKDNPSNIWYSNNKDNGYFNTPKVVFGRLTPGVFVDSNGDYGVCQDCAAIVDEIDNLNNIYKALKNPKFIELLKSCNVGGLVGTVLNRKAISLFRKDFWKDFV